MAEPLRYFSEAYFYDAWWWREGRAGPVRVWDRLDTSRMHYAERDRACDACLSQIAHSQRYHLESVLIGRRAIMLAFEREELLEDE